MMVVKLVYNLWTLIAKICYKDLIRFYMIQQLEEVTLKVNFCLWFTHSSSVQHNIHNILLKVLVITSPHGQPNRGFNCISYITDKAGQTILFSPLPNLTITAKTKLLLQETLTVYKMNIYWYCVVGSLWQSCDIKQTIFMFDLGNT